MRTTIRVVFQLLREFGFAVAVACGLTAYNVMHSPQPAGGWGVVPIVTSFGGTLFVVAWFTGQLVRVRNKIRTDDNFGNITAQLQRMLNELDAKTTDLVGHITGGDGVPFLFGLPDNPEGDHSPRIAVYGKYSQRDVVMTILEVPFDDPNKAFVSKRIMVGDVIFGHFKELPPDILDGQKGDRRRLFITFQGLNGTARQFLHLNRVDGQWRAAVRLMGHGREILARKDPGYPQQPDWIEDMRLSGVVLGGKPYIPLS
jgi:hypothetical protein